MCQELHLYSLYSLYTYCNTPTNKTHIRIQTCACMHLHTPKTSQTHPGIPMDSPKFIFPAWMVAPLWLQRSWAKTCKFFFQVLPKKRNNAQTPIASWSTSHNCWPYVATFRARTCWNLLQNLGWTPAMKPQLKPHVPRCTENFMKWPKFHVLFGILIFET